MPRPRKVEKPPRRRRGTGSISVAADGTIRARLPAWIDAKRPAREFQPGQMAAALGWLDAHLAPQPDAPAIPTLGDWAGQWWETYVAAIHPPNTAKAYLHALKQLEPLYGTRIDSLRPSMLQARVAACTDRLAPATLQGIVGVWRRCLDVACDDGLLIRNPARKLAVPAAPVRSPARHVTAEEVAALWPAIRDTRFEAIYAVILGCGLRIGEVLGLHWASVDWARSRLWVKDQYTNGHWRPLPKGRNPHWVPLPAEVLAALRRQRRRVPDGELVFPSEYRGKLGKRDGKPRPWRGVVVRKDLAEIVARLGIESLTPHAGRHGLATLLLAGGVDPAVIGERLGNSAAMVLSTYAHVVAEKSEQADRLVAQYLGQHSLDDVAPGLPSDNNGDDGRADAIAAS